MFFCCLDTVGISTKDRGLRATLVTDCRVREERCISRSLAVGLLQYKAGYSISAKYEMTDLSTCSGGDARRLMRKKRGARQEK